MPVRPTRRAAAVSGPALRWLCARAFLILFVMSLDAAIIAPAPQGAEGWETYVLDYERPVDPMAQRELERLDATLRARWELKPEQTAVGWLDLRTLRLAMVRPDRIEYAASVPKIGILLAWFAQHTEAALDLEPTIRHRLGLMIKQSSNEEAAAFSRELGLGPIQATLNRLGFYDASHGGGLWVGKHYGKDSERHGDPVADHSHAATVRQLLRFYLLLEQGRLISPAASARMREIFDSPEIPHVPDKFVQALAGRGVQMRRKSGTWEQWQHDTAVVWGPDRYYILVALTHAPAGEDYLVALARGVDDGMKQASSNDGALGDRALPGQGGTDHPVPNARAKQPDDGGALGDRALPGHGGAGHPVPNARAKQPDDGGALGDRALPGQGGAGHPEPNLGAKQPDNSGALGDRALPVPAADNAPEKRGSPEFP